LFTRLQRVFRLVPVTARDLTAFHRISVEGLPFTDGAVIANGAVLLVPGTMEPDEDWSQEMARLLAPWQHPLKRAQEFLDGAAIPTRLITGSRVNGESVPSLVGIAMRRDVLLQGRLRSEEALMSCFDGEGLRVADLGPELHLLPPFVGKQIGLRAFVERHAGGCGPLLALGDTPEDLGFMQNSTFMGLPTRSPLAERLNGRSAYAEEKTERTVDRKRAE
jgi:hydroxymethylpyrimidine pyrophosphatase-like HAD family hydrolase